MVLESSLKKRRESSAKKKCVNVGQFQPILIPLMLLFCSLLMRAQERTLAHKMKRYGDRGSPCLRPLDGTIVLEGLALIKI